jgi:hypothetical protein
MPDLPAPEKTQVEIPHGVLEYTLFFERPILRGWEAGRLQAIEDTLGALKEWGFAIDGMEVRSKEKLGESALVFRRTSPPTPPMSITLMLTKIIVSAENLDWSEADNFANCVSAGLGAITANVKPVPKSQQVVLAMHIQCKTRPRGEVTARLVSETALQLMDGPVKFPGIILVRDKCTLVVDASVAFANGLFVRIIREHGPDKSFKQMGDQLLRDEQQLFGVLGLEGPL